MLCFMCYEPLTEKALQALVGDVYVYICEDCLRDLNLKQAKEQEGEDQLEREANSDDFR